MVLVKPGVCLLQGLVIQGCRLGWLRLGASTSIGNTTQSPASAQATGSSGAAGGRSIPIERGCIFGTFSCPGSRLGQSWCRFSDRHQHNETLEGRIILETPWSQRSFALGAPSSSRAVQGSHVMVPGHWGQGLSPPNTETPLGPLSTSSCCSCSRARHTFPINSHFNLGRK